MVLINELGIRNDSELAEAEAEIISVRITEWSRASLVVTFSFLAIRISYQDDMILINKVVD